MSLSRITLALALALSVLVAPIVHADVLVATEHFRFHEVDGTTRNTRRIAAQAEARYAVLCRTLNVCDIAGAEPIEVWLAPDAKEFASAFPGASPMAEWAVGVAFVHEGRIVLRAHGSALFSLDETFDHELSHVLLYRGAAPGHVPRWFSEGVAIWQAGESVLDRMLPAQQAALTDRLVPLAELSRRFPAQGPAVALAYAEAALFLRWAIGRAGPELVPSLVRQLREGVAFGPAFEALAGVPLEEAELAWRETLDGQGLMFIVLTDQNVMWTLLTLLFLVTARIQILRKRRRLAEMAAEEALVRAARETQRDAALSALEPTLH